MMVLVLLILYVETKTASHYLQRVLSYAIYTEKLQYYDGETRYQAASSVQF